MAAESEIVTRKPINPFGWGHPQTTFREPGDDSLDRFLTATFGKTKGPTAPSLPQIEEIGLPRELPNTLIAAFEAAVGAEGVHTDRTSRVEHSTGRSTKDLLLLRRRELAELVDAVVVPQEAAALQKVIALAEEHRIALVPFGGGTSVVGGVDPLRAHHRWVISIDMTALNRIVAFDEASRLVTAEAGIYGVDLERYLQRRGFTVGHFPQSFEYTTLGGWVSARSSGQNSIKYGSIDALVHGLTVITPRGEITTGPGPHQAGGPDLKQLLIGSEGIWGFVTRATVRVMPLPAERQYFGILFRSFEAGQEAARAVVQSESQPAMVRLSDGEETRHMRHLAAAPRGIKGHLQRGLGRAWLRTRGFGGEGSALMVAGFEGSAEANRFHRLMAERALQGIPHLQLGRRVGEHWLRDRFHLPYARDALLDRGLLTETFETATEWDRVGSLYRAVMATLEESGRALGAPVRAMCHLSHLYTSGACLYFTMACPQLADPLEQWRVIKEAATRTILAEGGVISHHHGVGSDHRTFLQERPETRLWRRLKEELDPCGVMNPGKVV